MTAVVIIASRVKMNMTWYMEGFYVLTLITNTHDVYKNDRNCYLKPPAASQTKCIKKLVAGLLISYTLIDWFYTNLM